MNGTDNTITGGVSGPAVQAGAIHGGVHFHATGPVTPEVVPRQLPPPPAHVTGRTAEFAAIERLTDTGDRHGPAIVVISGPGGVGKSTLALRWLHAVAARYPDGLLFVDLAGEPETDPVALGSVLGRLLRAFGVTAERVPIHTGEATAMYRSMTAGRRVAMLVENPMSAAQVRTLLPASPESVVVVATRWRLGGLAVDGAGFVALTPFGTDLGTELLRRSLGEQRVASEPGEVTRLVELCGGLPIALSVSAARLATRPDWPVGRLVRELADERRRLSTLDMPGGVSVPRVFDVSYTALSSLESRAYRWLGLLPGPSFHGTTASAVLVVSEIEADDIIDALVDANLVDAVDADTFRFHDLVRLHARNLADREDSAEDRNGVLRRLLEHHVHHAATVDRIVMPQDWRLGPVFERLDAEPDGPSGPAAALDELEADLPNLMAGVRTGAELGYDRQVWQLVEAMWSLFLYRKHFPEWIAAHRLAALAARRCGEGVVESRMIRRLGLAFHNLNRPDEAVDHAERALVLARAAGSERAEAEAWQLIGMANRARGRTDEALAALTRTVTMVGRLGLTRNEALARRALGQTLLAADRHDDAVPELRRAKEIATTIEDAVVEAVTTVWLADALVRAGRASEALTLATEAWAELNDAGSDQYRAHALAVWGQAAAAIGDLTTARDLLTEARDRYAALGTGHSFSARATLADVETRLAPPDSAR